MEGTAGSRKPGASRGKPNLTLLRTRIRKGLSRGDLADLVGISEKQVGLIERGIARHSRETTLTEIADALETDVFALFPERRHPVKRRVPEKRRTAA